MTGTFKLWLRAAKREFDHERRTGNNPNRRTNSLQHFQPHGYGIILQCKPLVDADNRITVAVHAEVSNLSGQSVDGQPIISTRHAEAVINPDSGASMLIGGLKNVQKIPFLGDIPILGEFFKNKRELSSNRRARLK